MKINKFLAFAFFFLLSVLSVIAADDHKVTVEKADGSYYYGGVYGGSTDFIRDANNGYSFRTLTYSDKIDEYSYKYSPRMIVVDLHDNGNYEFRNLITFISKNGSPVKVSMTRKINIDELNLPDDYSLRIESKERVCAETAGARPNWVMFGITNEKDGDNIYLPDFTNTFSLVLEKRNRNGKVTEIQFYDYVRLYGGESISFDLPNVYVDGKKIGSYLNSTESEYIKARYARSNCFTLRDTKANDDYIPLVEDVSEKKTINPSKNITVKWDDGDYALADVYNTFWRADDGFYNQYKSVHLGNDILIHNFNYCDLNSGYLDLNVNDASDNSFSYHFVTSVDESKPINIVMNKKISLNGIDLPEKYHAEIDTREAICDENLKSSIFYMFLDHDMQSNYGSYFYLPDFSDTYYILLARELNESSDFDDFHYYQSSHLNHGDSIKFDGFDIYVNGDKLEEIDKKISGRKCFSFSEEQINERKTIKKEEKEEEPVKCKKGYSNVEGICVKDVVEESEETKNITVKLKVTDPVLDIPIEYATVYIDNKFAGMTSSKGKVEVKFPVKGETFDLVIVRSSYQVFQERINVKNRVKISIELDPLYEAFDIPDGYEYYINSEKFWSWVKKGSDAKRGYVYIHPGESDLSAYSYPITTDDRKEALLHLTKKIKKDIGIEYDDNCVPEINSKCEGWHESDYDVIEAGKGVCSDYATLGVSFANSYQIPARFVEGCWIKKGINAYLGKGEKACHAFSEAYIEGEGWVHYDTLWEEIDNPCVYSKQAHCFFKSKTGITTNKEEDLTEKYGCNNVCKEDFNYDEKNTIPTAELADGKKEITFNIKDDKILVSYREFLEEDNIKDIIEDYKSGELDVDGAANYLLDMVDDGFKNNIKANDLKFVIDSEGKAGINFQINRADIFAYDIYAYQDIYHVSLQVPKNVVAVLPYFDEKEEINDSYVYKFNFEEPGVHNLLAIFDSENSAVVSNHPVDDALAQVLSEHIGADHLDTDDTISSKIVYIIGGYDKVSHSIEESLQKKGAYVIRFDEERPVSSAKIAAAFWQQSDNVVFADMYKYESLEKSTKYALDNDLPLLLVKPDKEYDITEKVIEHLNAEIVEPNKKSNKGKWVIAILFVIATLFYAPKLNSKISKRRKKKWIKMIKKYLNI